MRLAVVEGWCCSICENEFNRGARSAERSMCECGAVVCYSCRADPRNNQAVCTFCQLATDAVRFGPFRRDHVDIASHHNDLVVGVQGQRVVLLQHDGHLGRQEKDLVHLFDQSGRLLGVATTQQLVIRSLLQRITELEARVFLLPRPVQVRFLM